MKSFALATLASCIAAQDDPLSRVNSNINMVVMINAPGLVSPEKILNLAQNTEDEALWEGRLTPMGQRQQFLIGSELRKRYVDEAMMMEPNFVVSQSFLQAPFQANNILSMQAQMMGMFPASDQNNLTEWQQGNAVPPIKGADFSKW